MFTCASVPNFVQIITRNPIRVFHAHQEAYAETAAAGAAAYLLAARFGGPKALAARGGQGPNGPNTQGPTPAVGGGQLVPTSWQGLMARAAPDTLAGGPGHLGGGTPLDDARLTRRTFPHGAEGSETSKVK